MASRIDPTELPLQKGSADGDGSPYDRLTIGGFTFKRVPVTVSGKGVVFKTERKSAKGASGERRNYQGTMPAELTISWVLWSETYLAGMNLARLQLNHFSMWDQLLAEIAPRSGKAKPAVVKIFHPLLAGIGVDGNDFYVDAVQVPSLEGQQLRVGIEVTQKWDLVEAPTKVARARSPERSSAEAARQAVERYDDLAARLANETDPLRRRQLLQLMDDAAGVPIRQLVAKPSKTSTKP